MLRSRLPRQGALAHAHPAILVSGMPRSGTTWLARLLAAAPGCALTGREPMNPRGRQYALAGTLTGWTRLSEPTSRQARSLRLSYRGLNPMVYSRYGRDQWAAPLPQVRVVVKDPFAMLSLPAVTRLTGARTVLLFRHPGAALASYRRMGWVPDVEELRPIVNSFLRQGPVPGVVPPPVESADDVAGMAWFWNALYGMALTDIEETPETLVVSHQDLAKGGVPAARTLFSRLGLTWTEEAASELAEAGTGPSSDQGALHNFNREPASVAEEWRARLSVEEVRRIEEATLEVRSRLASKRLDLQSAPGVQA